jgi:glycine/D-amino acid oxidase-like deaminating enzyme
LSQFLLKSCLDRGVQLHHPARALSIGTDLRDELSRVRILKEDTGQESDIPCTKILIAAGAWSPRVFSSLVPSATRKLPISSLAGHSLVVQSPGWANEVDERGCHAVFTTDEEGYSPEIFSRAGPAGPELYIAGLNSAALALPELPTESEIDERAISKLQKTARRLLAGTKDVEDLEILRKGLCFRPVTKKGTPILCRIPDEVGLVLEPYYLFLVVSKALKLLLLIHEYLVSLEPLSFTSLSLEVEY